jgi:hypothetical protein
VVAYLERLSDPTRDALLALFGLAVIVIVFWFLLT